MCLQYQDHGWDSYSPDGIQSQYGYALSHQEANYFGKKEKERSEKKKNKRKIFTSNPDKKGKSLKMVGKKVQKQGRKKDKKRIHLSGELNSLAV